MSVKVPQEMPRQLTPPDEVAEHLLDTPTQQSPAELLASSAHRPFPVPQNRPWVMAQTWQRLLFVHYPVPVAMLRPLIPAQLEIDTFEGDAWIGIVPFLMTGVRLRGFPSVPGTATFPELNVRTYVRHGDKSGVWFFSLDAANPLAVIVARQLFNLPYFHADMAIERDGDTTNYTSTRTHRNASSANYDVTYRPTDIVQSYAQDSLDTWFTERYVLYTANGRGKVFIGHITHQPWQLQPAEVDIRTDTTAQAAGITLPDTTPIVHYAHHTDVLAWMIEPIT